VRYVTSAGFHAMAADLISGVRYTSLRLPKPPDWNQTHTVLKDPGRRDQAEDASLHMPPCRESSCRRRRDQTSHTSCSALLADESYDLDPRERNHLPGTRAACPYPERYRPRLDDAYSHRARGLYHPVYRSSVWTGAILLPEAYRSRTRRSAGCRRTDAPTIANEDRQWNGTSSESW
jgi:hypothetical protein